MSVHVISWVLRHSEVQGGARLVLIVLADHASSDGTNSWPTVETIQHETRLQSRRSVQRALRQLEELGAIESIGKAEKGQASWTVLMEGGATVARASSTTGASSTTPGGVTVAPSRASQDVVYNRPEPSNAAREAEDVWNYYVEVMAPRSQTFPPAERALITEALKVASAVECKGAIDGCRASAFHMGENDRGKKYNRLSHILKGKRGVRTLREQIDFFLDLAENAPSTNGSSVDAAILSDAKRDLLDAWEFPGNEMARKAAEESASWLARHGVLVEYEPVTGRPIFKAA